MPVLSIYNITPTALKIDGASSERVLLPMPSEAPRAPGVPVPPQAWLFDVPVGQHSLVYSSPGAQAVMGTVTVPEAGLMLDLRGNEFVVLREPLTSLIVPEAAPPRPPTVVQVPVAVAPDMSMGHRVFMVAGTVAIAAWVWHFATSED